jgi:hypothetical protein
VKNKYLSTHVRDLNKIQGFGIVLSKKVSVLFYGKIWLLLF